MPTDPFVAPTLDDTPRNEANLAPGVHLPAARAWRADRPGDLVGGNPTGDLLGRPGPNVGFALTLAHRASDRMTLAAHEESGDALAVVAEVAMKRASSYGRGPTTGDVDLAMTLLGYRGDVDPGVLDLAGARACTARTTSTARAGASSTRCPESVLRTPPTDAVALAALRESVRSAFDASFDGI